MQQSLHFSLDTELSKKTHTAVLYPFLLGTANDKKKEWTEQSLLLKSDKKLHPYILEIIEQEKTLREAEIKIKEKHPVFSHFRLYGKKGILSLQKLAAAQVLFIDMNRAIFDFFSDLHLRYVVEEITQDTYVIEGQLENKSIILDTASLVILTKLRPHIAIEKNYIRLLNEEITQEHIRPLTKKNLSKKELKTLQEFIQDEPSISLIHDTPIIEKSKGPPQYTLKLTTTQGAFLNLLFHYDEETVSYPGQKKTFRDSTFEDSICKKLVRSGFEEKELGTSHFYCPTHKAKETLLQLLRSDWQIYDHLNRKIIPNTLIECNIIENDTVLEVSGTAYFGEEAKPLQDAFRAIYQKNSFVTIDDEHVGFLHLEENNPLFAIAHEVTPNLTLHKTALGIIEEIASNETLITFTSSEEKTQKIPLEDSLFKGALRPYQYTGTEWLHTLFSKNFSGILADDMGLGKTVQVLAFLAQCIPLPKTLIVVPTSLISNWTHEITHFLPNIPYYIHHGKREMQKLPKEPLIITSYGLLRKDVALFQQEFFDCLIVDEAHYVKNKDTKTAAALKSIPSKFRVAMTGTPVENSIDELWSHFHFLLPDLLGSFTDFQKTVHICGLEHIKKKIAPFILRRKKEDVAQDLPEKIEETIFVTMTEEEKKSYNKIVASYKKGLLQKISRDGTQIKRLEVLEAILRLRQFSCHPELLLSVFPEEVSHLPSSKYTQVFNDIKSCLFEKKKILLFSQFTTLLDIFSKDLTQENISFVRLDGATTNRSAVIDSFQNDPNIQLFLISLKAGGVGLNLTQADYVFLFDPWWNETQEQQAISRAHRIGRKGTVISRKYITQESIEEKILFLKEKKQALIEELFSENPTHFTIEELTGLLEEL